MKSSLKMILSILKFMRSALILLVVFFLVIFIIGALGLVGISIYKNYKDGAVKHSVNSTATALNDALQTCIALKSNARTDCGTKALILFKCNSTDFTCTPNTTGKICFVIASTSGDHTSCADEDGDTKFDSGTCNATSGECA